MRSSGCSGSSRAHLAMERATMPIVSVPMYSRNGARSAERSGGAHAAGICPSTKHCASHATGSGGRALARAAIASFKNFSRLSCTNARCCPRGEPKPWGGEPRLAIPLSPAAGSLFVCGSAMRLARALQALQAFAMPPRCSVFLVRRVRSANSLDLGYCPLPPAVAGGLALRPAASSDDGLAGAHLKSLRPLTPYDTLTLSR